MKIASLFPCDVLQDITVHRPGTQSSGSGGQPTLSTTLVGTIAGVHIEKLTGGQAARAFGDQSSARWRLRADDDADLAVNDLVVLANGIILEVEDIINIPAQFQVLACHDTDKGPS